MTTRYNCPICDGTKVQVSRIFGTKRCGRCSGKGYNEVKETPTMPTQETEIKSISIVPTWRAVAELMLRLFEQDEISKGVRIDAEETIRQMARVADLAVAQAEVPPAKPPAKGFYRVDLAIDLPDDVKTALSMFGSRGLNTDRFPVTVVLEDTLVQLGLARERNGEGSIWLTPFGARVRAAIATQEG